MPETSTSRLHEYLTFPYKTIGSSPILLDVYAPRSSGHSDATVPAVVYFHGGGLTVGNRRSWFPRWLQERVNAAGVAFISADYRLLPPSTGSEIVEDVKDLFTFLSSGFNDTLPSQMDAVASEGLQIRIDPARIVVAGNSAGGLCAYLAAMHAIPRPRAIVAMYAMGGDFLTPHYLTPKTTAFFRGREMLDPRSFDEYLPPQCTSLPITSDSPLAYHSSDAPIPGYPANPRMLLARLYLQLGTYLDLYTGIPDLSSTLRQSLLVASSTSLADDPSIAELLKRFPEVTPLFPQYSVSATWPPTFLVHGAQDTAVPPGESLHMQQLLEQVGVPVTLRVVPNKEHSFDYAPDAEEEFGQPGGLFDEVKDFILEHTRSILDKVQSDSGA